jgi:hypothetical protein
MSVPSSRGDRSSRSSIRVVPPSTNGKEVHVGRFSGYGVRPLVPRDRATGKSH